MACERCALGVHAPASADSTLEFNRCHLTRVRGASAGASRNAADAVAAGCEAATAPAWSGRRAHMMQIWAVDAAPDASSSRLPAAGNFQAARSRPRGWDAPPARRAARGGWKKTKNGATRPPASQSCAARKRGAITPRCSSTHLGRRAPAPGALRKPDSSSWGFGTRLADSESSRTGSRKERRAEVGAATTISPVTGRLRRRKL
jgi:hypothetical protein